MHRLTQVFYASVVLSSVLLLLYMLVDEPLTPLAREIAEYTVEERLQDNGSVYLWCFDCAVDDVYAAGVDTVKHINERMQAGDVDGAFEGDYQRLELPPEELMCNYFDAECDVLALADELDLVDFRNQFGWASERLQSYLQFPYYSEQVMPDADGPVHPFKSVVFALQVRHLIWLAERRQYPDEALVDLLQAELVALKRDLQRQDRLIGRMIAVKMINQHLQLVAHLWQAGELDESELEEYRTELTLVAAHWDLRVPVLLHYVADHRKLESISQEVFRRHESRSKIVAYWSKYARNIVVKSGHRLNQEAKKRRQEIEWMGMQADEYYRQAESRYRLDTFFKLRNPLYKELLDERDGGVDYRNYISRIHQVQNNMRLLQTLMHCGVDADIEQCIVRSDFPFRSVFDDSLPTLEEGALCFAPGPGGFDRANERCMRVAGN